MPDTILRIATAPTVIRGAGGTIDLVSAVAQGPAGPTGAAGATGPGVPVGGTTSQALLKASGTNYDTVWATLGTAAFQSAGAFDAAGAAAAVLPSQTGNAGKFLKTDGTAVSWAAVPTPDLSPYALIASLGTAAYQNVGAFDPGGAAAAAQAVSQPLDGDLTALAALSGTNTIYYRSAANTWSAVTIGGGLGFTGGTLSANVTSFNTRTGGVMPVSGDYTVAQVTGAAPLASPTFTGVVQIDAAGAVAFGTTGAGPRLVLDGTLLRILRNDGGDSASLEAKSGVFSGNLSLATSSVVLWGSDLALIRPAASVLSVVNNAGGSGALVVGSPNTTTAGLTVNGIASATAPVVVVKGGATPGSGGDLQQWQDSAGVAAMSVTAATANYGPQIKMKRSSDGLLVFSAYGPELMMLDGGTGAQLTITTGFGNDYTYYNTNKNKSVFPGQLNALGVSSMTVPTLVVKGGATPGVGGHIASFQKSSAEVAYIDATGTLVLSGPADGVNYAKLSTIGNTTLVVDMVNNSGTGFMLLKSNGGAGIGFTVNTTPVVSVNAAGSFAWSGGTVGSNGNDTDLTRPSAAVVRVGDGAGGDGGLAFGVGANKARLLLVGNTLTVATNSLSDNANLACKGFAPTGNITAAGSSIFLFGGNLALLQQVNSVLSIGDNGSGTGVGGYGHLRFSQIQTNSAVLGLSVPGTVVGKVPFYNVAGTLLGYAYLTDS